MAREGYLILDSDLHMMEPDDLWVRYLDEPYRSSNPPRVFGGQLEKLAESSEDKGNADGIEGMEVQGLAIPAHVKLPGPAASRFEYVEGQAPHRGRRVELLRHGNKGRAFGVE